jgi:hypothetical protein
MTAAFVKIRLPPRFIEKRHATIISQQKGTDNQQNENIFDVMKPWDALLIKNE